MSLICDRINHSSENIKKTSHNETSKWYCYGVPISTISLHPNLIIQLVNLFFRVNSQPILRSV